MIYFRSIPKPGSWDIAESIGRDKDGDLVKIVHGVEGVISERGYEITLPGFAIDDMNGNRMAWHYHQGAGEQLAADIARQLRRGVSIETIQAINSNKGI